MKLIQRMYNDIHIDELIDVIKRNRGCCDEIWIPVRYGYPSYETHAKTAEEWERVAEDFRKIGVSVSMQISNTLGHGEYISGYDCSALEKYDPFEKMVGPDGTVSDYCFCFRGKKFRKYILKSLSYYLKINPERIWVDDDLRPTNHKPVDFCCFCDDCISEFNAREKTSFTRKEICEEILRGDSDIRYKYVEFVREGIADFTKEISEFIHENLPYTVMCSQHGAYGAYEGGDHNHIFNAMFKATGLPPCSRPGGSSYDDHNPWTIIQKAETISYQNSHLPLYVKCKCPEIENLPFNVYGKTMGGTAFESSVYFASGNTDMSYSMIKSSEPMEFYEKGLRLFASQRAYWEELSDINQHSYQSGIHYYLPDKFLNKKLCENEGFKELNKEYYRELDPLMRDGIPVSYDKFDKDIIFLHPESAKCATKEELYRLMEKPVITDVETLSIMQEKGIDFGFEIKEFKGIDSSNIIERYTKSEFAPEGMKEYSSSFFTPGRKSVLAMKEIPSEMEVISYYEAPENVNIKPLFEESTHIYGVSSAIIKTAANQKWAIFGYCFWKGNIPFAKRQQILKVADSIALRPICAKLETPMQAVFWPRINEDKKTVCASIANVTMEDAESIEIVIRNSKSEDFRFASQYNGKFKLDFVKSENEYKLKIPDLKAFSVGTVFCN